MQAEDRQTDRQVPGNKPVGRVRWTGRESEALGGRDSGVVGGVSS